MIANLEKIILKEEEFDKKLLMNLYIQIESSN